MKVEKSLNIKTSYSFEAPLYNVASKLGLLEKDSPRIESFDLSNFLVSDYENSFLVRVIVVSMIEENIFEGDILVVNKKVQPTDGKVVIASLNGEMAVKRFRRIEGKVYLYSANKKFLPIEIQPYWQFEIQGIVKHVIKNF